MTAGPESLEDNFQKSALLGQRASLNLWLSIPGQNRKTFCNLYLVIFLLT